MISRLRRRRAGAVLLAAALALSLAGAGSTATSSGTSEGIWVSPAELAELPTEGVAWATLQQAADGRLGRAKVRNQDSDHDVRTLAVALVYARTGDESYREKAADAIDDAIGSEEDGRTLALGRNLVSYVIAADLIRLGEYDSDLDEEFRDWLDEVRTERLDDDRNLIQAHEERPNNWGAHAGASRIAADIYLGDTADLERAADVFRGYLGDRLAYSGFEFGNLSWQADPDQPVGVNPEGAVKEGVSIDGALPDDMRRGDDFENPPEHTDYPWEALQGAVVAANLLDRAGYDAWEWEDQALRRAVQYLYDLDAEYGGWAAEGDDLFVPWLVNDAYGTDFPTTEPVLNGKNMGWTDWTHRGALPPTPGVAPPPPPVAEEAEDEEESGAPVALIAGLAALGIVVAGALAVVLLRRRRPEKPLAE
jgi:hypothetical protein